LAALVPGGTVWSIPVTEAMSAPSAAGTEKPPAVPTTLMLSVPPLPVAVVVTYWLTWVSNALSASATVARTAT